MDTTKDFNIKIKQCVIDRLRSVFSFCIKPQEFHLEERVLVETYSDEIARTVTAKVVVELPGIRGDRYEKSITHSIPSNTWQFFKEKNMPTWFKNSFPVKYNQFERKFIVEAEVIFPTLKNIKEPYIFNIVEIKEKPNEET